MTNKELEKEIEKINHQDLIEDLQRVAKLLHRKTITIFEYDNFGKYPYYAPKIKFGSWKNAMRAAKLRSAFIRDKIKSFEIINDVKRTLKLLKKDTLTSQDYKQYGKYNHKILNNKFGSWGKVLQYAGIKMQRQGKISDKELIDNLKAVAAKLGRQPKAKEMIKPLSEYNSHSYERRFHSWGKALQIIGFENKRNKIISEEELLENIKEVQIKLGRVPKSLDMVKPLSKYSYMSYTKRFGTWNKTLAWAGFSLNQVHKFTPEELIKNLKEVEKKLGRAPGAMMMKKPLSEFTSVPYFTVFGSWNKALEAAGLPIKQKLKEDELINNLKEVYNKLGRVPKSNEMKMPISKYTMKPYYQRFDSWEKALDKAGLKFTFKIAEADLSDNFREVQAKLGRPPKTHEMKRPLSMYTAKPYITRFGSWNKTLEYMGLKLLKS